MSSGSSEARSTDSGIAIEPVYHQSDVDGMDLAQALGEPGQYPFTRGPYETMYRQKPWTMRQYAGFATAEETNERFRYLLANGAPGLSMAFDLPTQLGMDSDDPRALGEVGRVGVAIDSVDDMSRVFDGIPLSEVSTSMTINAPAAVLLLLYRLVGESQGVAPDQLRGTIQNDILKEYVARGNYIYPPHASMRLTTDTFAYCAAEMPRFNTISISGYHIREAGSTAVQEVAFTLANAIAYIEAATAAGQSLDAFGTKLSFFFNASSDFFEEVAKFRAARRLYARIVRDRFGCASAPCQMLRFHTQTAGHTLTAVQTDVNIVRVTLQALAAVLGGTQSLHTNAPDEALALPTEESARLALRIQQLIAEETGVAHTADPLGGSYLVEQLTDRIEQEATALIERIDQLGGMVKAVETGWVQNQIEEAAYRHQCEIEAGTRRIVGINCHVESGQASPPIFKIDPTVEAAQIERVREIRSRRNAEAVALSLRQLDAAVTSGANVMPAILSAVRAYVTLGEICDLLRAKWGVYSG